ncbi:Uncharacterised protein [Leminorella grimontii]|nr:Uncharacterised protein [Leminorella grimontii]
MSNKRYPRVSKIIPRSKNTSAKCRCGVVAKYLIEIQVNCFRGDDERLWSCDEHRNNCEFLISGASDE